MFAIDYNHCDFSKLIADVAVSMNTKVKNDILVLPEEIGDGYFKSITLSYSLQCLMQEFTCNQDIYIQQKSCDKEYYILRFDEISIADTLMVKIDNDYSWEEKQERASALLTSSLFDFAYSAAKGTSFKSINVLITAKWISQYLDIESLDKILQKYIGLKTAVFNFAPFDVDYRTLFNEVLHGSGDAMMRRSIVENRIMLMVEKFLNYLYHKENQLNGEEKITISDDEIKRLMEVESYLVKDFSAQPPSISFLARVAAMSATTLKNKFKKLYGNSLYEYFQKNRMQRAKALLMSHKYSIKEIGSQLGYTNLSNFATAFKKEFDKLPSQLILNNQ